jgi:hypothetical protein
VGRTRGWIFIDVVFSLQESVEPGCRYRHFEGRGRTGGGENEKGESLMVEERIFDSFEADLRQKNEAFKGEKEHL